MLVCGSCTRRAERRSRPMAFNLAISVAEKWPAVVPHFTGPLPTRFPRAPPRARLSPRAHAYGDGRRRNGAAGHGFKLRWEARAVEQTLRNRGTGRERAAPFVGAPWTSPVRGLLPRETWTGSNRGDSPIIGGPKKQGRSVPGRKCVLSSASDPWIPLWMGSPDSISA